MRAGIIDLGTNTFNLLIADLTKGKPFESLLNTKSAVMLGDEGINQGYISDKAFSRAYTVLRGFSQQIKDFNCDKVVAFGTSAIRSASNSEAFISKISEDFGINIEPITGQQEAEYIYRGVSQAVEFSDDNYLILDIGGGSIEFIIANNFLVLWKQSLSLGGARLLEKFKPSDPIALDQISHIEAYLSDELEPLVNAIKQFPVTKLIGSSGAFDSYAEMIHYKLTREALSKTETKYPISIEQFKNVYQELIQKNRDDRYQIPGLEAIRVNTIVMSSILTQVVLNLTNVESIIQSSYSLKEGVAAQLVK